MDNEKEIEISVKDLFNIVKRGLWIIVVAALVFGIAAFGYSKFFVSKTYTSNMKMYVESTDAGNSYNNLASHNYAKDIVNTYIQMLNTNSFCEKVSANLSNKYTAAQLKKMIKYDNSSETEVFSASVVAGSPTEAKIIADSVATVAPAVISGLESNARLKIVDSATIPTAPSSPNVTRNTILATAIGIVLALIYVLLKEFLDNKIKYNPDMTDLADLSILAAIPDFKGPAVNLNVLTSENTPSEASEEAK